MSTHRDAAHHRDVDLVLADVTARPASSPVTSAHRPPRQRPRLLVTLLLALGFLLGGAAPALAQPGDPASVPPQLRQYVIDSVEWQKSPWMTAPGCREQGGDFSQYAAYMIKDLVDLLGHFQPDFAGTDANAAARKELLVRKFREVASFVTPPPGYCVAAMKKWAKPNPGFKPFGFEWGTLDHWDDSTHGVYPFGCTGEGKNFADALGPCRGFYITCFGAVTQQENTACEAWNAFSDDFVKRMNTAIDAAYKQYGIGVECGPGCTKTVIKSPGEVAQEFLNWVAKEGMEQVVSFIVSGVTSLWASFTKIAIDYSAPNVTGLAFGSVYNLVAGIALALAFLGWVVSIATSWKRGRLQYSLIGGVKAIVGVTLAAVGAILMLQLADECTKALVSAGGDITRQADFTGSLIKVNPIVAVVAGIVIAISLIFSIIFLVLHGALVLMWALFGSVAAAGQVNEASSGWLLKWAARGTALAWAKFFMVAVMLLIQALLLPLDPGEDAARQVVDVIQGLAMAVMMVSSPYLLMELIDFASDRIGGAGASSGPALSRASQTAGGAGRAVGGAAGTAVSTMMSAGADLARKFGGASAKAEAGGGGGGKSPGGSTVPRPEPGADTKPAGEKANQPPSGVGARPSGDHSSSGGGGETRPHGAANRGSVVSSSPTSGPSGDYSSSGGGGGGGAPAQPARAPRGAGAGSGTPKVPPP